MKQIQPIEFTEYETIIIPFLYEDGAGNALSLPDVIEAEARDVADRLICRFEVVNNPEIDNGFFLKSDKIIKRGNYLLNIFYTDNDVRTATDTRRLKINYSPTKPASLDLDGDNDDSQDGNTPDGNTGTSQDVDFLAYYILAKS